MRKLMIFTMLTFLTLPFSTVSAMANNTRKENAPELQEEIKDPQSENALQEGSDVQDMRAQYDEINAIKMKKYDELTREIAEIKVRIEGFRVKEQELSGEKEKAESDLAERVKTAESASANVKKALGAVSAEDEKMRNLVLDAAKESAGRRAKIEKMESVLKEADTKMEELQSAKDKAEAENSTREAEYKDVSSRLTALKGKSSPEQESGAGEPEGAASLKKIMSELEAKIQEGERVKRGLSEEILASAEKIQAAEEAVSALESDETLKAKELRGKIEAFDKAKKEDKEKARAIEGAKKAAEEAALKVVDAKAALQKTQEELEQVSQEKLKAEKDLAERTEGLKVRISALVAQNESDRELFPKAAGTGQKDTKESRELAEKEAVEIRRKADQALLANKELQLKFDKEMLKNHFNMAVIYERNGLYADSEKEYLECLKIDRKDADVHYNLAILYDDRLNDNTKAQKHYYEFLSLRPMGESGERVRDWVMRSELEKRLGSTVR